MKVTGGSFGVGKAYFKNAHLIINAAKQAKFTINDIESSNILESKSKKFGMLGFVLGALFLVVISSTFLTTVFGMLMIVLAIAVLIMDSFYTEKEYSAEVTFKTGEKVYLAGTKKQIHAFVI